MSQCSCRYVVDRPNRIVDNGVPIAVYSLCQADGHLVDLGADVCLCDLHERRVTATDDRMQRVDLERDSTGELYVVPVEFRPWGARPIVEGSATEIITGWRHDRNR
jgi:hypothetical protein